MYNKGQIDKGIIVNWFRNLFGLNGITDKQIESLGFTKYVDKFYDPNYLEFRIEREKSMFVLLHNVRDKTFACYLMFDVYDKSPSVIFTAMKFFKIKDLNSVLKRSRIFTEW